MREKLQLGKSVHNSNSLVTHRWKDYTDGRFFIFSHSYSLQHRIRIKLKIHVHIYILWWPIQNAQRRDLSITAFVCGFFLVLSWSARARE